MTSREDLASVLVGALSQRPQGSLTVQVCLRSIVGTALPRVEPDPTECPVCRVRRESLIDDVLANRPWASGAWPCGAQVAETGEGALPSDWAEVFAPLAAR